MGIVSNIRAELELSATELLEEYRVRLMAEAMRLCRDESAAEDLVMRTFERYFSRRPSYDPQRGSLLAWLRSVMRNLHTDSLRKRRVEEVLMSPDEIERVVDGQNAAVPDEDPEQKAREERLIVEAVDSLSPKLRAAVVLHYFECLPLMEVARSLCISENSVKQRLYYARKVLAKRLGKTLGRAAPVIAAILFGGSLLYAAAVVTGIAPSPFAAEEDAAEEAVAFNAKSTENTEGVLTGLTGFTGLSEAGAPSQTTNHESPASAEATAGMRTTNHEFAATNIITNNKENTMNTQSVKSAAVKALAAGAMLAATVTPANLLATEPSVKYLPVEYLESTGTQYINTGFNVSGQMRIEADFAFTDATTVQQRLFGSHVSDANYLTACLYINGSALYAWAWKDGTGNWASMGVSVTTARKCLVIDGGLNTVTLTDVATGAIEYSMATLYNVGSHSKTTLYPLAIFATIENGKPTQYGKLKLYSLKISSNGEVVRSYVPCVRASDGVAGLYEPVEDSFLTNAGTGEFTAGPYADNAMFVYSIPAALGDSGIPAEPSPVVRSLKTGELLSEGSDYEVSYTNNTSHGTAQAIVSGLGSYAMCTSMVPFEVRLPVAAGMKSLEYVEVTGAQYVNTGIVPTNHQIEVEYQVCNYVNDAHVFGTDYGWASQYCHWTEYDGMYYWGYNGSLGQGNTSGRKSTDFNRHEVICNRVGDNAVIIDGEVYASSNEITSAGNLFLGRRSGVVNFKGRIYFFRVTNRASGKVEMELAPAMSADGVPGFYDRVSGRFLPSANDTPLVAGPEDSWSDFSVSPIPVQHDWSGGSVRPTIGSRPALVVSNLVAGTELREGVDYTVSYLNNVSNGIARAVVTGAGSYAGQRDIVCFRVYNSIFEEYTPLESIETTGFGSWIWLDYIQKTSTWVRVVSYAPSDKLSAARYQTVFGSRRSTSSAQESFFFQYRHLDSNHPAWARNAVTTGENNTYPYDEWVELVCGTNNGLTASWTGLTSGMTGSLTSSTNVPGSVPFVIFGINNYNGYGYNYDVGDTAANLRLASFEIYEGATQVRDFKPVRRLADGAVGVYDPIENVFFANRGSGTILAGREFSPLNISCEIPDQPYRPGVPSTPTVAVTDYTTGETLAEGVHYTVSYTNNAAPGVATMTLTGKAGSAYEGITAEADFTIYPVYHVTAYSLATEGDGYSWSSPMSLTNALASAAESSNRSEVWLASGTYAIAAAKTYAFTSPLVIRGGFGGWENSAAERIAGGETVLDGGGSFETLKFTNAQLAEIERVTFSRSSDAGLFKNDSAGDLVLKDCRFVCNGLQSRWGMSSGAINPNWDNGGAGARLRGTTAALLVISGCAFDGNTTKADNNCGIGGGLFVRSFGSAWVENSSFTTNYPNSAGGNGGGAAAAYILSTPITFTNCAFRGNQSHAAEASTVILRTSCGGSKFVNCLFAGNDAVKDGAGRGIVNLDLASASDEVVFRNCTFAYNLCGASSAIRVSVGSASVANSIFFGNLTAESSTIGADIHLGASGSADIAWTAFAPSDDFGLYVDAEEGASLSTADLLRCDPLFVTTAAEFLSLFGASAMPRSASTFPAFAIAAGLNVHLRGYPGYNDEAGVHHVYPRHSPAVDAGNPNSDYKGEPDTQQGWHGKRVNLGAYGNTQWATMSPRLGSAVYLR